jgi:hypothetical protein
MFDRFKVAFAASRSELAALVGATLAISLSGYKMLENSPIASDCFPWSDKCFAAIGATPTGFKVVSGIIILCAISLIWLNYKKFRDSWRKAKIEPVGFFFDRVSQPENTKETIEYSLVEVRRNGTGGLEYRGVGRRPNSQRPLEYRWRAREAVVRSSGDDVHKLFFRVRPGESNSIPRGNGRTVRNWPTPSSITLAALNTVCPREDRSAPGDRQGVDGASPSR